MLFKQVPGRRSKKGLSLNLETGSTAARTSASTTSTTTTSKSIKEPSSESWDRAKFSLRLDEGLSGKPSSDKVAQENPPKRQSFAKVAKSQSSCDFFQSDSSRTKAKEPERRLASKFSFRLFKMNGFFNGGGQSSQSSQTVASSPSDPSGPSSKANKPGK